MCRCDGSRQLILLAALLPRFAHSTTLYGLTRCEQSTFMQQDGVPVTDCPALHAAIQAAVVPPASVAAAPAGELVRRCSSTTSVPLLVVPVLRSSSMQFGNLEHLFGAFVLTIAHMLCRVVPFCDRAEPLFWAGHLPATGSPGVPSPPEALAMLGRTWPPAGEAPGGACVTAQLALVVTIQSYWGEILSLRERPAALAAMTLVRDRVLAASEAAAAAAADEEGAGSRTVHVVFMSRGSVAPLDADGRVPCEPRRSITNEEARSLTAALRNVHLHGHVYRTFCNAPRPTPKHFLLLCQQELLQSLSASATAAGASFSVERFSADVPLSRQARAATQQPRCQCCSPLLSHRC